MIKKLLFFPIAVLFACVLAGVYGAVHNQLSYSVSPDYFHEFKFAQFNIPAMLQDRFGASIVGVLASWWMGLVIGVPLYLVALMIPDMRRFVRTYMIAALIVIGVTFFTGLGALIVGVLTFGQATLPIWLENTEFTDPIAFAQAAQLHNFSYVGGLLGLVAATVYLIVVIIRLRREARR